MAGKAAFPTTVKTAPVRDCRDGSRLSAGTVWLRAFRLPCIAVGVILMICGIAGSSHAQTAKADASLTAANGYARLLLQFNEEVSTEVVTAGAILVVRFAKPVDLPVDKLSDAVPAYVGSARRDPDGSAIRLALAQKVRVNVMTAGERVYIDLLPEKWTGLPPPLPAEVVRELSERALAAERALRLQKTAEEVKKKPAVRVRTSVQPTFVRFVFELPDGVSVSSSLNADKFSLSFSSALTFDLADVQVSTPANIKSVNQKIDGDTSSVDIFLVGDADVHAFRDERNYIVDVAIDDAQKLPLKSTLAKPLGAAQASPKENPATVKSAAVAAKLETKPETKPDAKPDAKADLITTDKGTETPPPPATPPPAAALVQTGNDTNPPVAVSQANPDGVKAATVPQSEPRAPVEVPVSDPGARSDSASVAVTAKRTSDDFKITFPFGAPVTSALFRRSDTIWLVVANDSRFDLSAIVREANSIVAEASSVPVPNGQAIRIKLSRPQLASLDGDDRSLVLTLSDKAASPPQPLSAMRNIADPALANVTVALSSPGAILRFSDPDVGDVLTIVTAPLPARGFIRRQNFVEFAFLESIHGVVIQPNSDDVTANIASDKIIVSRPGGLTLSASNASPEKSASPTGPTFDVNEWQNNQKANFGARLDELIRNASLATDDDRLPAHMTAARFYIARGFYAEAKGILDLALSKIRTDDNVASAYVLHSVASTLAGRPDIAIKDLENPAIGSNIDAQVWKAFAYGRLGKWQEAREKFKNVEFTIMSLPVDLQRLLLVDAMRAALEVRDYSTATARGNDLQTIGVLPEQQALMLLLRGRLAEALARDQDALANFHEAAASPDRPVAAEAMLSEIALRQKRNEVDEDQTTRDLETLSTMWRGDNIEIKNLAMLVHLYAAKGRYSEAFAAAFSATRIQPNSDISRAAMDEASALFAQIYLTTKGDELPPVEALAMFYEYRSLTPIGRRGDQMIRRLADRLVAVDLLDQASELLQYQVDHRLEGAARAQVASRLAMIYLMNRKPDRAIAALRSTRIADLAGELRQQRLLLEGRAQSDIGRHDLAIDIIANINGREAIRLRSDIFWAARRWRESSEQLEVLYGERWRDFQPLTDLEKSDVIRATIGYALAEDALGLARFREKYGPKMDNDGDRSAFAIASKPASANSADFARIAKIAATIDTLDGFLREMKTRFPDAVASAKLPPEIKVDTNPTGSLPEIVGFKKVSTSR